MGGVDVTLLHIANHSGKGLLYLGVPRHPHIPCDLASCTRTTLFS